MLKKLLCLSTLLSTSAFAAMPGYYLSFGLGYSKLQSSSAAGTLHSNVVSMSQNKTNNWAARIGVGYAVKPSYSMEIGFARYGKSTWNTLINGSPANNVSLTLYAFNWMNRMRLFHTDSFDFYTSLGLAYVYTQYKSNDATFSQFDSRHPHLRPEVDLGADYALSNALSLNATFTYILGKGKAQDAVDANDAKKFMPNVMAAMLGVNYQF